MIKILHTADLQVKNRDKDLFLVTEHVLNDILDISKTCDIVIIAGDLFEYSQPNDSERKLIYNFLSKLIMIDSVKEIIIIAGNHDIDVNKLSKTKHNDSFEAIINNPLNIFNDIAKILVDDNNKLRYFQKSDIYTSNAFPNDVEYMAYSFEDGIEPNTPEFCISNPITIGLHHDMLKEYIDDTKLPIRQDVYDKLKGLDIFYNDTYVLAGHIHNRLIYQDEKRNVKYYYPGAPMEHTFGEGTYFSVGQSIENKSYYGNNMCSVNIFTFDELKRQSPFVDFKPFAIKPYIKYITVELDPKIPFTIIKENLSLLAYELGIDQTYIKVKSANIFAKHERDIFDIIYSNVKNAKIDFEYSKYVQQEMFIENSVIKDIIENKKIEFENKTTDEVKRITSDNIDNLILTKEQIGKLFKSVLSATVGSIKKEIDDDLSEATLMDSIFNMFYEQLDAVQEKISKRYNIKFKKVKTTGFMPLGPNEIDLDIPGITRIVASNGVGKTTLYNMIRWIITGKVYDSQKSNTTQKNNLIVFNKNLFENDEVVCELYLQVNNFQVKIIRSINRIWKNNVTLENKVNIGWEEYVSKIEKDFKLDILDTNTNDEKHLQGDGAEKLLLSWFGNSINNILFLNSANIDKMLKSSSDILNELILNFIGVDYLKLLETNLDSVKENLLSTNKKPTRDKEDIKMALADTKIKIKKIDTAIEDVNKLITDISCSLVLINTNKDNINTKLNNLGNVEDQISVIESTISKYQKFIDSFELKELLEKKEVTEEKPVLDEETITKLNEKIVKHEEQLTEFKNDKTSLQNEINDFDVKSGLNDFEEKLKINIQEKIASITEEQKAYIDEKETIYLELLNECKTFLEQIKTKISERIEKKNQIIESINKSQNSITDFEKELEGGVCPKCRRPYELDKEWEEHKKTIEENIIKEKENIKTENENLAKIKDKIEVLKSAETLISKQRDEILGNKKFTYSDPDPRIDKYNELSKKLDDIDLSLNTINTKLNNLQYLHLIKFNNFKAIDIFVDDEENQKIVISFVNTFKEIENKIVDFETKVTQKNDKINLIKDAIQDVREAYNNSMGIYTKIVENTLKYNTEIDTTNKEIQEYNKQLNDTKLLLANEEKNLVEKKLLLPDFVSLKKEYTEVENIEKEKSKDLKEQEEELTKNKILLTTTKNILSKNEEELSNYIEYIKNQLIWKIYSKLIKTSFKEIVFDYYRIYLNNTLNELLIDVNFKLFWNKDSELFMTDYKSGKITYQSVQQSCGMETIFLGLSLIYTICLLNVKNSLSHIFVDELSGALNDGKNLSYEAANYQELFVKILNKFTDKSIFIIDHVIDNMFETVKYIVRPDEKGSIFEKN